jgi:parvulin-like peptidyl-prolyl isomerase
MVIEMKSGHKKSIGYIRIMTTVQVVYLVVFLLLSVAQSAENRGVIRISALKGDVVAEVANEDIGREYFKSYLSWRPQPSGSQAVREGIEKRLEELIVSELLYQEALRRRMHLEPNIRWRIQQMLAQRLLEEKVSRPVRERLITEQELEAYYNEHISEFRRPRQVRLADIFIAIDSRASSAERLAAKKKTEGVLTMALAPGGDMQGFRKLVKEHSDRPKSYLKGNTGFFDIQGKPVGLDPNLVREAFKLRKVGQVCDHIIVTADGYHIIMLTGRREAVNKPFEKVAEQLRQRIYRQEIERTQTKYIESLRQKCQIKINQDVLDELIEKQQVKAKALEVETRGGFLAFPKDANVPPRKPRGPK